MGIETTGWVGPRPDRAVGVFLDAENVAGIDERTLEELLQEVAEYGPLVVRRAYGRWSNPGLARLQRPLTALGFELIHAWHPVKGKDSADILMVVDAMTMAMRMPDLGTFVLITSDSDFSPLFRRLREMGRAVIGVGRQSALSEMVMRSCSRYIFLDRRARRAAPPGPAAAAAPPARAAPAPPGAPAPLATEAAAAPAVEEPLEIVRKEVVVDHVLRLLEQAGRPMVFPQLKEAIRNVEPAFDERALGYRRFSEFLRAIPEVHTFQLDNGAWAATVAAEADSG